MSTKKTLILAVVLAALALFVFLHELPYQRDKEQADAQSDKVIDLDFDQIANISLERADGKISFTLDKDTDEWRMTEPVDDQTERWLVQSLVSAIQHSTPTRKIEDADADALERFGLAQPRAIVTFDTGQVVKRVRIGDKNPVGGSTYVKPEDESVVYLIPASGLAVFEKQATEFRRKSLLSPLDAKMKLRRVVLKQPDLPPIELYGDKPADKSNDQHLLPSEMTWRIGSATGPPADQEVVKDILDKISVVKAGEFFDTPTDEIGFAFEKPLLTVTAVYAKENDETSIVLIVGAKKKLGASYYVRATGRDPVFAIHQSSVIPLLLDRAALRDRRLIPALDKAKVAMIDLQSPWASFRVSRSVDGWAFADEAPAAADMIDELLSAATAWRAEALVGGRRAKKLARVVRGSQVSTITLLNEEAQMIESVRFSDPVTPETVAPIGKRSPQKQGDEAEKRVVALVTGGYSGTVYLTNPEVLNAFPRGIDEFRAPAIESSEDSTPSPEVEEAE